MSLTSKQRQMIGRKLYTFTRDYKNELARLKQRVDNSVDIYCKRELPDQDTMEQEYINAPNLLIQATARGPNNQVKDPRMQAVYELQDNQEKVIKSLNEKLQALKTKCQNELPLYNDAIRTVIASSDIPQDTKNHVYTEINQDLETIAQSIQEIDRLSGDSVALEARAMIFEQLLDLPQGKATSAAGA